MNKYIRLISFLVLTSLALIVSAFAPLAIVNESNGEATLTGPVRDQSELHGLIDKIFNLNLTLLAVNREMEPQSP